MHIISLQSYLALAVLILVWILSGLLPWHLLFLSFLWHCFLKWRGLVRLRAELSCLNLDSAPLLMQFQTSYSTRFIPVPAGSSAKDLWLVIHCYKENPQEWILWNENWNLKFEIPTKNLFSVLLFSKALFTWLFYLINAQ